MATFATGANRDGEAPSFSGVRAVSPGAIGEWINECGNLGTLKPAVLQFDAASDGSPGVSYDVYVDGMIAERYVESSTGPAGAQGVDVYCDIAQATLTGGITGVDMERRAVDIAGNESAAQAPIAVSTLCTPPRRTVAGSMPG